MILSGAWEVCRKDWRLFLRDRTALLLSLALPIFLATIFAAAMGGFGGGGAARVHLLVEDLDQSARSQSLVRGLEANASLRVERALDTRRRIADGKAPAALVIPAGWGASVGSAQQQQLALYRDPGATIEQQILAGALLPALLGSGDEELTRGIVLHGMGELGFSFEQFPGMRSIFDSTWEAISKWADEHAAQDALPGAPQEDFDFASFVPRLVGMRVEDVAGGEDATQKSAMQSHAISGIAVMMLLFGLVAAGGTILEEHEQGTLQRLRLAPGGGSAILPGKFLFTATLGCAQLAILFVFGGLVFSVPVFRDPLPLVVLSLAVVAAATGLGLALAMLAQTRKQLEGFSTLVILVMSALGGSWFPLIATPAWYQKLGHFTLNAWAMDGYQAILWYGKGLGGIWLEVLVLLAIAAGTSAVAARAWKRRFLSTD
ncbi:MAG: ABC transporter permease [Planctomycetes bacterium]|nr:ABC transporter permease [Planctomycetota bacterium]